MEEYDEEITLQRALEEHPQEKLRLISDNGFLSQENAEHFSWGLNTSPRTFPRIPAHQDISCLSQSNGKIERFPKSLKQECLRKRSLIDLIDARKQIGEYID